MSDRNEQPPPADLLGPVILYWLHLLHQHIRYLDDGETTFLYCTRAGLRIRELYRIFLREKGFGDDPGEVFRISRLAVCKGVFGRLPERAGRIIEGEFAGQPLQALLESLVRNEPALLQAIQGKGADARAERPASDFGRWLGEPDPLARKVNAYLDRSTEAFARHVHALCGGRARAVLLDTGWKGTAQSLLAKAFPEIAWKGVYFGRIPDGSTDPDIAEGVIGTLFDAIRYDPDRPETAFVLHRHLIEALLETNAPSIEETLPGAHLSGATEANENETPDPAEDAHYIAVREYVRANATQSLAWIHGRYQAAIRALARRLAFPSRKEALELMPKPRSADFGKSLRVPVLLPPEAHEEIAREQRLSRALWPQGQIALEYPEKHARDLQARSLQLVRPEDYFHAPAAARQRDGGRVAVITRTKNRPILLRRAAESVAAQSHADLIWVVVNDGGDPEAVEEVVRDCFVEKSRIVLIHHPESLGMEAASNAGIAAVAADFVLIHDDDDSLAPEFLERTVAFLQGDAGAKYGGVVTRSVYVSEEIRGERVVEHARTPFMPWVQQVQLAEMATGNFFPPIAFLYRREMWEEIGGYCESLPVFGDWKFNLDFLSRADIGFLPESLAHYHHRDRGLDAQHGAYSNSLQGGIGKHVEYEAILRNMCIRGREKNPVLAELMASAYLHAHTRHHAREAVSRLDPPPVAATQLVCEDDWKWVQKHGRAGASPPRHLGERLLRWALGRAARRIPLNPTFDEETYLQENPDIAAAVRKGAFASGYEHYLRHGCLEGRRRPTKAV